MASLQGNDSDRLLALFDEFAGLYPLPDGFGWSLRSTMRRGTGRRWYFLARIDWRGEFSAVPAGTRYYYLSEFCAFLEALIAAKRDPVLSGALATENGAKK